MDYGLLNGTFEHPLDFPQHLCKKCGKCCRAICTPYSYEELVELSKQGQEEARVFVEMFKRYNSVEEARAAVPDQVENIINSLKKNNPDLDESKLTFYYCPNLREDNFCTIYQTRPDCCRRVPHNGWSLLAPDCGFKGWQFQQREKVKASVRKLKEYLAELGLLSDNDVLPDKNKTVKEMRNLIQEKIKPWEKYGAAYW